MYVADDKFSHSVNDNIVRIDNINIEDKDIVTGAFVGSQSNGGGYNLYFQEPMNGGISIQYNF